MYGKAMELYRVSFPPHEQREAASQERILSDREYGFYLIYDKEIFVGLLLCWETERFTYVEHFCTLPEMRNRGYGKKTLELLQGKGRTVLLEIDPPAGGISERRREFYRRNGFKENPYPHVHPPYHRENKGHPLVLMSNPDEITEEAYESFRRYLENRVMKEAYD